MYIKYISFFIGCLLGTELYGISKSGQTYNTLFSGRSKLQFNFEPGTEKK